MRGIRNFNVGGQRSLWKMIGSIYHIAMRTRREAYKYQDNRVITSKMSVARMNDYDTCHAPAGIKKKQTTYLQRYGTALAEFLSGIRSDAKAQRLQENVRKAREQVTVLRNTATENCVERAEPAQALEIAILVEMKDIDVGKAQKALSTAQIELDTYLKQAYPNSEPFLNVM